MSMMILYYITITISILLVIFYYNYNILYIIDMYKKTKTSVSVLTAGGLGNRLMSFAGIIVLSIYYKSKPLCIPRYIIISNRLERI